MKRRKRPCPRPDKQRHTTPAHAWAHARHLASTVPDGALLGAYPCGDHWHVGNRLRTRRTA